MLVHTSTAAPFHPLVLGSVMTLTVFLSNRVFFILSLLIYPTREEGLGCCPDK